VAQKKHRGRAKRETPISNHGAQANQPLKAPRLRAASKAHPGNSTWMGERVTAGNPDGVVKMETSRNSKAADFVHKSAARSVPQIRMKSRAACVLSGVPVSGATGLPPTGEIDP